MKEVKIIGYRLAVIVLLAMLPIVVSAVEYKNSYRPAGSNRQREALQAEAPSAVFQSTSTLTGSGSALSATPMLNADGTAYDPTGTPSGPRRAKMDGEEEDEPNVIENPNQGDKQPIGDAVLPLLLMSLAFCGVLYMRKRKAQA